MSVAKADRCLLGDNTVSAWYDELIQSGVLFADNRQVEAIVKLQQLADTALAPKTRGGFLSRWLATKNNIGGGRGLYLHGGVGRGKSFLMDGFYLQLRTEKKMRAHFHQFMRRFHEDMKKRAGETDALFAIADDISARFDLLCFDEFHVSDITDAMILGRLLERVLDNGVRLVMTSNYAPKQLYPNGLARERFLPTIAMLEKRMEVFALDGDEDYRMRHMIDEGQVFFHEHGDTQLHRLFAALACGIVLPPHIKINGRRIVAVARSSDIIWFSFAQLCESAVGQGDYLSLAGRFATIIISGVPMMNAAEHAEAMRRFTWLVDILYDQRVTLIMSAAVPLRQLYAAGDGGESGRTLSRLIEMQSPDYWRKSLNLPAAN